jgi:hypothetical protein
MAPTASFADFASTFTRAHGLGLKGCTMFPAPAGTAAVLTPL